MWLSPLFPSSETKQHGKPLHWYNRSMYSNSDTLINWLTKFNLRVQETRESSIILLFAKFSLTFILFLSKLLYPLSNFVYIYVNMKSVVLWCICPSEYHVKVFLLFPLYFAYVLMPYLRSSTCLKYRLNRIRWRPQEEVILWSAHHQFY